MIDVTNIKKCDACGGTGEMMTTTCAGGYHQEITEACDVCDGEGIIEIEPEPEPEPAPQRTRMRDWKQT